MATGIELFSRRDDVADPVPVLGLLLGSFALTREVGTVLSPPPPLRSELSRVRRSMLSSKEGGTEGAVNVGAEVNPGMPDSVVEVSAGIVGIEAGETEDESSVERPLVLCSGRKVEQEVVPARN